MSIVREEFYTAADTKATTCCCMSFGSVQERKERFLENNGWKKVGEKVVMSRSLPSSSRIPCSIVKVEQSGTTATYKKTIT